MTQNQVKSPRITLEICDPGAGELSRMSAFSSKAAVKEHPFRLSLNVCFRPKGDIRIFLKTLHKTLSSAAYATEIRAETGLFMGFQGRYVD